MDSMGILFSSDNYYRQIINWLYFVNLVYLCYMHIANLTKYTKYIDSPEKVD